MPSVAQAPLINTVGFMLKEKSVEPVRAGFTPVNGRTSPTSPPRTNGINGMNSDTIHVRPLSRNSSEETQDRKVPLPLRDEWNPPAPRVIENGLQNGHQITTGVSANTTASPDSPGKRKRSSSFEDDRSYHSQDGGSVGSRRRLDSYTSVDRDDSPNTISQLQATAMQQSQQRNYPMDRAEQNWPPRDTNGTRHGSYSEPQHRDAHMETSQDSMNPSPTSGPQIIGAADSQNLIERQGATATTRAGVQVDPKKRKRQFANRTKTGCGTCRRRKKKCDEAKPECNNCTRGGFICEGYAHKIPWPKNSISKGHIPLQAKDRFPVEPQLYHSHGHNREGYPDPNAHSSVDGARGRPIVVEEQDQRQARNGWGSGWPEPPRASYPPERPPSSEYAHSSAMTAHSRPQSNDHHVEHPNQTPAPQRQHNPRIYHHTPQTMSQVVNNSPAVTAQLALQHQSHQQQPMHPAPPTGPPGPPPSHHAPPPPPKPQKTEKEKMLSGEHYLMFHPMLVDEREQCKAALYRFNSSSNPALGISREERARHFRTIIEAPWTRHARGPEQPTGYLGNETCVEAPFTCEYGYNIHISDGVVIGSNCTITDSRRVTIGTNVVIGPNVSIYAQTVPTDPRQRNGSRGTAFALEVTIGDNVFIGGNVTILPGIKVGKGATIGAGSVVTRNVPPHVVVMGNPARVSRGIWAEGPYPS
ncbi:hypothetical protein K469DRAFT_718585 [Zopfia rhizophila CBS 207.26]|uniref:Zn(2)-C6 fungal-type domain-containing protein n=1 Tax=Zopfia rhizophila CBS 207.26 TaxID=1314779 RepID=A0A6A6DI62_9PEZI|nr:hypothetical protein K469DRAFT_718585 [Zopfia rhizophila CBS 207.26]